MQIASSLKQWVQTRVGSSSDFSVGQDLDRLQEQVDQLKKPVEVSLQGSYSQLSLKDKLVLGASSGAVVGAGLGAVSGFLANTGDGMKLNVAWTTHPITAPSVEFDQVKSNIPGTTTVAGPSGLEKVTVDNASVRYDFRPRIVDKPLGEYKTPDHVEVQRPSAQAAAVSGLIGAGVGAALGVTATLAARALAKNSAAEGTGTPVQYGDEKKTMIVSAALGTGVGAGLGAVDGLLEQARSRGLSQELTWSTPIMRENVKIGDVPQAASVMIRRDVAYDPSAFNGSQLYRDPAKFDLAHHIKSATRVDITGNTPEKTLLGSVKMQDQSKTYLAEARYGLAASVLSGAVVGGLCGLAVGVSANVLKKMIEV